MKLSKGRVLAHQIDHGAKTTIIELAGVHKVLNGQHVNRFLEAELKSKDEEIKRLKLKINQIKGVVYD